MKEYKPRKTAVAKVVYPAIADWLRKNDSTICSLAVRMGYTTGNYRTVYDMLYGKFQPTIPTIRKLLSVTGLTFEEVFGGVDNAQT